MSEQVDAPTTSPWRRLLSLVDRASGVRERSATVDVWPRILSGGVLPADHYETVRRLRLWVEQVDALESALRARKFPDRESQQPLAKLRTALRVTELGRSWDEVVLPHLDGETRSFLGALAYSLPTEEPAMSAREQMHLVLLAGKIREAARVDASLSTLAREFVERAIRGFEQSLFDVEISGISAIVGQVESLARDTRVLDVVLDVPRNSRVARAFERLRRHTVRVVSRFASDPTSVQRVKAVAFVGLTTAAAWGMVSLEHAGWTMLGLDVFTAPKLLGSGDEKGSGHEERPE